MILIEPQIITGMERSLCVTAWRTDTCSYCKARLQMTREGPVLMPTGRVKTALLRAPEAHTLRRHLFGHVGCCSICNCQEMGPVELSVHRQESGQGKCDMVELYLAVKK